MKQLTKIISFMMCAFMLCAAVFMPSGNEPLTDGVYRSSDRNSAVYFSDENNMSDCSDKNDTQNASEEAVSAGDSSNNALLTAQAGYTEQETTENESSQNSDFFSDINGAYTLSQSDILPQAVKPEAAQPVISPEGSGSSTLLPIRFDTAYADSLTSSENERIYTFNVSERGVISYVLGHETVPNTSAWRAYLYQEYKTDGTDGQTAYRLINTLSAKSKTTEDTSVNVGVMPGSYRVVVTSGSSLNTTQYSICVKFEARTDYEIECNDTFSRYTELYSGVAMKGTASYFEDKTDYDFYMLHVNEDGFIKLRFAHADYSLPSVCWRIAIYDSEGNEICYQNSLFSSTLVESGSVGVDEGWYFVAVYGHVYCDGEYTLRVDFTPDSTFESEYNDTPEKADEMSVNSTFQGTSENRTGVVDKDYYSFTLTESGYISLHFGHNAVKDGEGKNGWNITLLSEDCTRLYSVVSAWTDTITSSPNIGLAAGKYYILIDNENLYQCSEVYTVGTAFTPTLNWEKENNNTMAAANTLYRDVAITGTLAEIGTDYDTDYYKFTLTDSSNVKLTLSHEVLQYDREGFVLRLYTAAGLPVPPEDGNGNYFYTVKGDIITTLSSNWSSAEVSGYYSSLPPGTYYARMQTGLYYTSIRYNLTYSLF